MNGIEACGHIEKRDQIEREVKIALAGLEAEKLLTGRYNWVCAGTDLHNAVDMATFACGSNEQTSALIKYLRICVRDQLSSHVWWPCVETVAKSLLKHKRLGYRKVRSVIRETLQQSADCEYRRQGVKRTVEIMR